MYSEQYKRGSGRTTRMIGYALELAEEGQEVLMVFGTSGQANDAVREATRRKRAGVTYAQVRACSVYTAPPINWKRIALVDANTPNHQMQGVGLLVDHAVIYLQHEHAIDGYLKFDDPLIGQKYEPKSVVESPAVLLKQATRRMRLR